MSVMYWSDFIDLSIVFFDAIREVSMLFFNVQITKTNWALSWFDDLII